MLKIDHWRSVGLKLFSRKVRLVFSLLVSTLSDFTAYYTGQTRSVVQCNRIGYSYTMGSPHVLGDNPRALASGLSYVQVDKHCITILYHQHLCRPCISRDISC